MKVKGKETLLFLLGLVLLYFSNGRMAIAAVTFIAPIIFLLLGRKMKVHRVYLQYSIGMGLVYLFAFWKFSSTNIKDPLFYIPFFLGFLMSIPYVVDAFFHQRKGGLLADLSFPLSYVLIEFIYVTLSPLGSTGSTAYAEHDFLVLLQLLSVTGIYGITFMVYWFGTSVATVIEDRFKTKKSFRALGTYGIVFVGVMVFGIIRLNVPDRSDKIKVAGISVYDQRAPRTKEIWRQARERSSAFLSFADENFDKLEKYTRKEAMAGAKVVIWAELSPWSTTEQIEADTVRMARVARENQIYLVTSPYVFADDENELDINEAMIFAPDGTMLIEHIKYGGAKLDGIIEGDKKLQSVDTTYGKMGTVVCWDADFPNIMRQTGKLDIEMLFSPAADWKEITPLHIYNLYYRGIENGMNIIRETASGASIISDAKGRIIEQSSVFDTPDAEAWLIRGEMPTKGCQTIYSQIGDVFAYLCMISLVGLVIWRLKGVRLRKRDRA